MDNLVVGLIIAFSTVVATAMAGGVAWVTKQVTEHSQWMAEARWRQEAVEADVEALKPVVARHEAILANPRS